MKTKAQQQENGKFVVVAFCCLFDFFFHFNSFIPQSNGAAPGPISFGSGFITRVPLFFLVQLFTLLAVFIMYLYSTKKNKTELLAFADN